MDNSDGKPMSGGDQFKHIGDALTKSFAEMSATYKRIMDDPDFQRQIEEERAKIEAEKIKCKDTLIKIVRINDLVRVQDYHHLQPNCYQVDRIDERGVVSQPACYSHWWHEIIGVYRYDGTDYKCIWEKEKKGDENE